MEINDIRSHVHYLRVDIEHTHLAFLVDISYGVKGRAVEVAGELAILQEVVVEDFVLHVWAESEVVVDTALLSVPGKPGGVWRDREKDGLTTWHYGWNSQIVGWILVHGLNIQSESDLCYPATSGPAPIQISNLTGYES